METVNGDVLYDAINSDVQARIDTIELFPEIASTNCYLLNQPSPGRGRCRIAIADHQTAGRGQRGNVWESPHLAGLYLSCAYTFEETPQHFSNLTLAIGIALADALNELGAYCKLKWPNDLILHNGKLGGILTETLQGKEESPTAVVGIGLNLDFGERRDCMSSGIGRVSDLRQAFTELPERSEISQLIIEHTVSALATFDADGFSSFHDQWQLFDWLHGKAIRATTAAGDIDGIASGIDDNGALLVVTDGATERIISGSVTLQTDGI